MTNSEYVKLCEELLRYNPNLSRGTRSAFIKRLKQSPTAVEQAKALFGERGTYKASEKDLGRFVADTVTSRPIDTTKYSKY